MDVDEQIPLLEDIFASWWDTIGDEYIGYRNHVYRMIHYSLALRDCSSEEQEKIIVAGAFHDLGIWIEDTADYLPPSIAAAKEYLHKGGLQDWTGEITTMISEHHKITPYNNPELPIVEQFRKGDLVDFSWGLFKFGLSDNFINEVKQTFPNAGFHKSLGKRAVKWFVKHPLNPAPMMKW